MCGNCLRDFVGRFIEWRLRMRIPALVIFLLLTTGLMSAQTRNAPRCELQQLAINAALGDAGAQYDLGVEFFRGVDVPQDFAKSAALWRMASKAGVLSSFNNLGYLTYYGKGVKEDHAEGLRLWRVAAEKGFAESQVHIAEAYSDGRFLKQDFVEAYAWAKAGKHFAARITDAELAESIGKMAQTTMTDARRKLSATQFDVAEKKAAEYIARYKPR